MTRLALLSLGLVAASLSACDQSGGGNGPQTAFPYPAPKVEESGEVVATIGPVVLTTTELEKRIAQQSPFVRVQLKDPEQKKKFVENEVKIELLAQEGWRRNLHTDPRVIAEMRRAIVQRVMRDEMAELQKKVDVSEEELRQGYEKRLAEYNKPETVRVAQIVMQKSQRKQAEALTAKLLDAQKRNDETAFADAVRKNSIDQATKNGGGELPFLTREELEKKFGKEAAERWMAAEVGVIALEDLPDAWVILKKTGKRRGTQRSLETVKPQLRAQLLAEKRQAAFEAYVDGLKKKDNVVVVEEAVKSLKVKVDAPVPGAATATTPETLEQE